MFGLFGKSDAINVTNKVWMSKEAKYAACRKMLELDPMILFIVWFEETHHELISALSLEEKNSTVLMACDAGIDCIRNRIVVFVEHYPLNKIEQDTFKRLMLPEANVLLSLDEPFFLKFGGERMIEIMQRLGMHDNEVLNHGFITRAIKNAQDKLQKKIAYEKPAKSQREWFELNA